MLDGHAASPHRRLYAVEGAQASAQLERLIRSTARGAATSTRLVHRPGALPSRSLGGLALIVISDKDRSRFLFYFVVAPLCCRAEATLEMYQHAGADPALIDLLQRGLGDRSDMEIRWERI